MFSPDQYELLDFGAGRKLERFGETIVDRPSPAAEGARLGNPAAWTRATARFDRVAGRWEGEPPPPWTVRHGASTLQLRATAFGHVGLFPEQAPNWEWLTATCHAATRPLRVLNLFAYTGASTLAAAHGGAEVTHIDAASNVVQWARRNAELSGLASHPIRWIAEEAGKFVERELRRGKQYDAVILDPPSYGHGPKGEPWKLETDLQPLLETLAQLTAATRAFILFTCHTPGYESSELAQLLRIVFGEGHISAGELSLTTAAGRRLPSGHMARWLPKA